MPNKPTDATAMKAKHTAAILFLWMLFGTAVAQDSNQPRNVDVESWNAASFRYKHNKKWSFKLQQQFRLKENLSATDRWFLQLESQYRLSKKFDLLLGFRHISLNDTEGQSQGLESHMRIHFDLVFKTAIKRLDLGFRFRYQNRHQLGVTREAGDYPAVDYRFKGRVGYDFKKWKLDPEVAFEIFGHQQTGEINDFNRYRWIFGTDYPIAKRQRLGLQYIREKEIKIWNPKTTRIIKIKYTYTFKRKKPKKND